MLKLQPSLRMRLILLVLAAMLPLCSWSVYNSVRESRADLESTKSSLHVRAALAASRQDQVIESARHLLTAIGQMPGLDGPGMAQCETYFRRLNASFPLFNDFGMVGTDGYTRCHSNLAAPAHIYAGDRAAFKEAIETGKFVVGGYIVDRLSGRDSLLFEMPVMTTGGALAGVAVASLDLERMGETMTALELPPGGRLTVIDPNGLLLLARGGVETPLGAPVQDVVLQAARRTFQQGVAEGPDFWGEERIYAYTATQAGVGKGLLVSVSVPRANVMAGNLQRLMLQLLVLAGITGFGVWAAGWAGRHSILVPTRKILDATRQLKTGDANARVEGLSANTAYELQRIAAGFNLMADALQQRQRDLEAELQHSRKAFATVDLILNSMHEGLLALDADGNALLMNAAAARLFPADPSGAPSGLRDRQPRLFRLDGTPCAIEDLPSWRALQGQSGNDLELMARNPEMPEGRMLRCSYRPVKLGDADGAIVVFTDITDLQRLQGEQARGVQQLRETQRKLMEALHIGRIGNWELDVASGRLWWSAEVYALLGYVPDETTPTLDHVERRIHPDDLAGYTRRRQLAVDTGQTLDIEFRIVLPDGGVRWLHQIGQSHRSELDGALIRSGVVQDITERKQAGAELVLLHNAVSRINDVVVITEAATRDRPDTPIVLVNDAFERLTGYSAAEALGNSPAMLAGPQTDPKTIARMQQSVRTRTPLRDEIQIHPKTGAPIWVELDQVPLTDDTGWNTHWIGVMRDVTGRKLAEQALIDSEQRYQALFDQGPLPMWVFDEETSRFLAVNTAACQMYGYSHEEFRGLTQIDIRPVSERARLAGRVPPGMIGGNGQWIHASRYGTEFPVEVVSRPIRYAGRDARFVVAHDISTRVNAEAQLQEHLFTLQRAADAAHAVVQHQTLPGLLQEVVEQSRAVIRAHQAIVTLKRGEWSDSVSAVSLSEKYAEFREYGEALDGSGIYELVCQTNRPVRLTQAELEAHPRWRGFGAHADRHPAMRGWLAVPLIGRDGANIGLMQLSDKYEGEFTAQDEYVAMEMARLVSIAIGNAQLIEEVRELNTGLEKKVTERTRQLVREEARYRALAEEAPQVVWNYEPDHGVTYFNRAWYDLVGGAPANWTGNRWILAIHPDDRAPVLQNWAASEAARAPFVGIRRLRAKDGSYRTMSYRGVPVMDENRNVIAWVGIDADVTEIKTVEEALRQSNQELEAFSYSVSHDLRSPLNSIDGFSRLLARQMEGQLSDQGAHYLARIQAGVSHMGQLIEGLLSLAQVSRTSLRSENVDVSLLARETLERCRQRDPEREAVIQVQDGMNLPGDPRLIRVVLDNLIGNAWKFTSKRAVTEIAVGAMPMPGAHATRDAAGVLAPPWVYFVRDNGAGFDMAYADKLFGVFQRLHAVRDFPGTGIGLATVHRIVTRHHGRVWAESQVGVGTTFYFTVAENGAPVLTDPREPDEA
ncbi:MAG: hypothetical protein CVU30_08385 [Betaproteobacteria bacterium HGW-Betaproteobacteria-3]|nr:MAG: hypothetical protein CVU30_08385 [Betaproteobacteria bacterium HGW-Betaproteobacteria-3]